MTTNAKAALIVLALAATAGAIGCSSAKTSGTLDSGIAPIGLTTDAGDDHDGGGVVSIIPSVDVFIVAPPPSDAAPAPGVAPASASGAPTASSGEQNETPKLLTPEHARQPPAIRLRRLLFTRSIKGKSPARHATRFDPGALPVIAFVEFDNPGRASSIRLSFKGPDGTTGSKTLKARHGRGMGTWGYSPRVGGNVGTYEVIVLDAAGRELGKSHYEIAERDRERQSASTSPGGDRSMFAYSADR